MEIKAFADLQHEMLFCENVAMHYCANVKNVACYKSLTLWNNNPGEYQKKFITLQSENKALSVCLYHDGSKKYGYNHCVNLIVRQRNTMSV